jgi:hypothetical protein
VTYLHSQIPPTSPYYFRCHFGTGGSNNAGGYENSIPGFNVQDGEGPEYRFGIGKTGYYTIFAQGVWGPGGSGDMTIQTSRGSRTSNPMRIEGGSGNDSGTATFWDGFLYAGDQIFVRFNGTGPYTWTNQNDMRVLFVPMRDYAS